MSSTSPNPLSLISAKVWIKTFGCQMNYHDTERLIVFLKEVGYQSTENKEEADLIIFNTCAIRNLANLKFYSQLGEVKKLKGKKNLLIGISGCIAQAQAKELLKKYKYIDFILGTDQIDKIAEIVDEAKQSRTKVIACEWDESKNYSIETKVSHTRPSAFVNIMKGCNNFCSYCIVPFTRGREKSRRVSEIVQDIKNLCESKKIIEVTLLGQNVNSFGKENGESLVDLLFDLEKIEKLKLIRYTTSHPYDLSADLIYAHKILTKLAPHVHLPAQSGSNAVLERMNRHYTKEHYLNLCKDLREAVPDIAISSDIIVGFPNETEAEFEESLDLLEKAQFDFIYSYKYSLRPLTKAALIEDSLIEEIRTKRLSILQKRQLEIQKNLKEALVGKTLKVLVEGESESRGVKKIMGRSLCYRIVHFMPPRDKSIDDYLWRFVDVKITSSTALACQGELIE